MMSSSSSSLGVPSSSSSSTYCLEIVSDFLPIIIDWLSNIPNGGMPPAVAIASIIPTLKTTLKHIVSWGGGRICNSIKRRELDDHIDNCFLLTKKVLFCADVERRSTSAAGQRRNQQDIIDPLNIFYSIYMH